MQPLPRLLRSGSVAAAASLALLVVTAPAALADGGDAEVEVAYDCTSIDVTSSKDISNVVLEFSDGDRQRFEDLPESRTGSFAGTGDDSGETITTAWIKSGNNKSGEGPGYGERVDFDSSSCEDGSGDAAAEPGDDAGDNSDGGDDAGDNSDGGDDNGDNGDDSTDDGDDTNDNADETGTDADDTENDEAGDDNDEDTTETGDDTADDNGEAGDAEADADVTGNDETDDAQGQQGADEEPRDADEVASTTATATDDEPTQDDSDVADDTTDAAAAPSEEVEVLGETEERGVNAAADTDVRSADTLPNTGVAAVPALLAALATLGLGTGLVRRGRRSRRTAA